MPTLTHPDGRTKTIHPSAVDRIAALIDAGFTVTGNDAPNQSDSKTAWVSFAEQLGVDPEGLTKAELIEATAAATPAQKTSSPEAQPDPQTRRTEP